MNFERASSATDDRYARIYVRARVGAREICPVAPGGCHLAFQVTDSAQAAGVSPNPGFSSAISADTSM